MMSSEYIRHESERAARRAKAQGNRPLQVNQATINDDAVAAVMGRIPMIGDWRPRGYALVQHDEFKLPEGWTVTKLDDTWAKAPYLFVDSCGFGGDSRALGFRELCDLAACNPGLHWAIVEIGQFQIVVAAFRTGSHVTH